MKYYLLFVTTILAIISIAFLLTAILIVGPISIPLYPFYKKEIKLIINEIIKRTKQNG